MIVLLIAVDRIFKVTELARVDRDDYEGDAKTDAGCMWHGSQVGYKCGWLGSTPAASLCWLSRSERRL